MKKKELADFDGSAAETFTEMQLIENQLEKMELEEEKSPLLKTLKEKSKKKRPTKRSKKIILSPK